MKSHYPPAFGVYLVTKKQKAAQKYDDRLEINNKVGEPTLEYRKMDVERELKYVPKRAGDGDIFTQSIYEIQSKLREVNQELVRPVAHSDQITSNLLKDLKQFTCAQNENVLKQLKCALDKQLANLKGKSVAQEVYENATNKYERQAILQRLQENPEKRKLKLEQQKRSGERLSKPRNLNQKFQATVQDFVPKPFEFQDRLFDRRYQFSGKHINDAILVGAKRLDAFDQYIIGSNREVRYAPTNEPKVSKVEGVWERDLPPQLRFQMHETDYCAHGVARQNEMVREPVIDYLERQQRQRGYSDNQRVEMEISPKEMTQGCHRYRSYEFKQLNNLNAGSIDDVY